MNTRDRDEVKERRLEEDKRLLQTALKDGRLKLPAGYFLGMERAI